MALATVANVTNTNVYVVRVRIDVHVIINGFPVDPGDLGFPPTRTKMNLACKH